MNQGSPSSGVPIRGSVRAGPVLHNVEHATDDGRPIGNDARASGCDRLSIASFSLLAPTRSPLESLAACSSFAAGCAAMSLTFRVFLCSDDRLKSNSGRPALVLEVEGLGIINFHYYFHWLSRHPVLVLLIECQFSPAAPSVFFR